MPKFVVDGGRPLSGTIRPAGNKNAALPIIAATLLTEEEVVLENVPDIRDVRTLLELLGVLGAEVEWLGAQPRAGPGREVGVNDLDAGMAARIRASILLAGPMLARVGPHGAAAAGRRRHRPPPRGHAFPGALPARRGRWRRTAATTSRPTG
jgi:UDP-N-acetylglucosamine 1-carboxyvinyltransferase